MHNMKQYYHSKLKTTSLKKPFPQTGPIKSNPVKPWNKRFIYEKMPEYDSTKDKNVIFLKCIRLKNKKKTNTFGGNYITFQQGMVERKKKGTIKSFNRTMSDYMFSVNNIRTNKKIHPIENSTLKDYCLKSIIINNQDTNSNDENLIALKKSWNDLCILSSYRELFIAIYSQLSGEEKEQLYKKEMSELKNVDNDIKSLNDSIKQRNQILRDLYEKNLELNKLKYNNKDISEDLLNDISALIQKLREMTVGVCSSMKKFKNDIYKINNIAKYNISLLSSKYKFDKNYLIKMKGEISFLKEGRMRQFFNITDEASPFLLKASESLTNSDDKKRRIIPIKEEIRDKIYKCNYYIYQELIAYQQNILLKKNELKYISRLNSNNYSINLRNNSFRDKRLLTQYNFKITNQNESKSYRQMIKNTNNNSTIEYPEIKEYNATNNNELIDKKYEKVRNILNQRINEKSRDLFSQKLMLGYKSKNLVNNIFVEDEKGLEGIDGEGKGESINSTIRKEVNNLIKVEENKKQNKENKDDNIKKEETTDNEKSDMISREMRNSQIQKTSKNSDE